MDSILERPTYSTVMIADMAVEERPRERLIHYGAQALATRELLAIVMRTGMKGCSVLNLADRLMQQFNSLGEYRRRRRLRLVSRYLALD